MTIKKTIDVLGGTLLIENKDKKGTIFKIILDQRIDNSTNVSQTNYLNSISKNLSNKRKILLIDDDYIELEILAKELKNNNFEVISTMYGNDCLDRLKSDNEIELVFIDDEMDPDNAVSIIEKIDTKKVKVILMLDKNKESIKKYYLEDYPFFDYLLKRLYKEEIKRIKNKI